MLGKIMEHLMDGLDSLAKHMERYVDKFADHVMDKMDEVVDKYGKK